MEERPRAAWPRRKPGCWRDLRRPVEKKEVKTRDPGDVRDNGKNRDDEQSRNDEQNRQEDEEKGTSGGSGVRDRTRRDRACEPILLLKNMRLMRVGGAVRICRGLGMCWRRSGRSSRTIYEDMGLPAGARKFDVAWSCRPGARTVWTAMATGRPILCTRTIRRGGGLKAGHALKHAALFTYNRAGGMSKRCWRLPRELLAFHGDTAGPYSESAIA